MYIRKSQRKYKDKTYTNYLLVESIHTQKGPRQKIICSLGDLSPRPRSEWLKLTYKVEEALTGQENLFESKTSSDPEVKIIIDKINQRKSAKKLVELQIEKVRTEKSREAGSVHVGVQFWRRLQIDRILKDVGLSERACKLTCAMVMNRILKPKSEHAMPEWIRTTALDEILGEDFSNLCEDALYRNLDRIFPHRSQIESSLAEVEKNIFSLDQTIYLYDLTSTYFEGQALLNKKACRGYSRDKRPDCPQVLIGLVINRDGFPLCHEVFEGNRRDHKTLSDMLDILDKRVGLSPGQTVVVDRGMSFDENLLQIRSRGLKYIVASRQSERDQWLSEFEEEDGYDEIIRQPSPNNPFQSKSRVRVKMKRINDEMTYILCLSEARKGKDRGIREKQEKRLLIDLSKLEQRINSGKLKKESKIGEAIGRLKERYPRVAKYYKIEYFSKDNSIKIERNEEKLEKARQLDGSYLLKTNREDVTAEEAWRIYMLLTRAENAFRAMKSPLEERPIFHQIERRVDTHIFLCVLAYHLLISIEKTLQDRNEYTSWSKVREILSTHQVSTVVLPTNDKRELRIRQDSVPESEHKRIYDLLGVPHKIMDIVKTWKLQSENSD